MRAPVILTVLRSGGDFTPGHVETIRDQCARHAPGVTFRCLSDTPGVPGFVRLRHKWPKWWSKIEALGVHGPCLYMDLDTVVVGDIMPLVEAAETSPFMALRPFSERFGSMASALMAWSGDISWLSRQFALDPERFMAENRKRRWWGDQGFIDRHMPHSKRTYWQDELPGAVVSWKKHCRDGVPDGARVICFHGRPRPWATDIYRDLAA